ncbi:MAG TPA: glycosyl hydrolase, partial [Sedimentisphaerales bacterium]|nr:glycosyl hydrolase [Sedimentisphaerales bacterium]
MDQSDHVNSYHIDRRRFLVSVGIGVLGAAAANAPLCVYGAGSKSAPAGWTTPPAEFSLCPFWFWNDALSEQEIVRQIEDFQAHGVQGFLIHPRAGLPRSIGWMSKAMIDFMRLAIEEAAKRRMWVLLYDEGMYPSGSSSGQVVAENPAFRTRGLFAIDLDEAEPGTEQGGIRIGANGEPSLVEGQNLVAIVKRRQNGHRVAVIDRAIRDGYSTIRGLHFLEDDPPRRPDHREVRENAPPGADILNPQAVECFIRLVYQRYYDEFKDHFGKTVAAIFTDEPSMLAKGAERGAMPGTTGILEHVNQYLGYDFTEHLAALWYKDEPDADRYRADYARALAARLEQTFYAQIHRWCVSHGVALTGHPAAPDDIGHLRHFDIPGQDIVWRYIEPGKPSALEGAQSTQAKCASSAMIHLGRRRNLNEYCGAFGHNFTFDEMKWLTGWLIVRGCNMLVPHAFYYSVRGPRIDERPPDVGPNSPWWSGYKPFAEACSRLCWLNTDSKHVCSLAILGLNDYLSWEAAKVCFQNQRDFNYLEARHLWEDARVEADGIHIAGMHYKALIVQCEPPAKAKEALGVLERAGRLIRWDKADGDTSLLTKIGKTIPAEVELSPATHDVRLRHVVKEGIDYYILFNEGRQHVEFKLKTSVGGQRFMLDPETGSQSDIDVDAAIKMQPHELKVLRIVGA